MIQIIVGILSIATAFTAITIFGLLLIRMGEGEWVTCREMRTTNAIPVAFLAGCVIIVFVGVLSAISHLVGSWTMLLLSN